MTDRKSKKTEVYANLGWGGMPWDTSIGGRGIAEIAVIARNRTSSPRSGKTNLTTDEHR
jgi:hypothetical protein